MLLALHCKSYISLQQIKCYPNFKQLDAHDFSCFAHPTILAIVLCNILVMY